MEGNTNLDGELEKMRLSFRPVEALRPPGFCSQTQVKKFYPEHKVGLVNPSVPKPREAWSGQGVSPRQGLGPTSTVQDGLAGRSHVLSTKGGTRVCHVLALPSGGLARAEGVSDLEHGWGPAVRDP